MEEIKQFIEDYVKKVKELGRKLRITYWDAQVTGEDKYFREVEKLSKELNEIYNDKESFEKLKEWNKLEIEDGLLKRQVKLLYDGFLSGQGDINLIHELTEKESKIVQKFNLFRAKVGDQEMSDNEVKELLKKETDSEKLKEAWEASKKQGELVKEELMDIIKLRNKLAKSLGFSDYYEMSLEMQEQNKEEIVSLFNELDELIREPFSKLKEEMDEHLKKRYNVEELKPWHYQNLFFQREPKIYDFDMDKYFPNVVEIATNFYEDVGLDVKSVLENSSLYQQKGKCQHAFCIDIDKEGDVRILQNVKDNEYWMETTLHELGHAVYSRNIDRNLPYILIDEAHTFTTEAIAMLFGRLSDNVDFIKKYGKPDEELDSTKDKLDKKMALRQLVFARWAQVMVNFERQLYENPDQDLNKLWWDLVKKYQMIDFCRDKPDWAAKIHLVGSPVYYHNYMLGELLASQLHNHIVNELKISDYSSKEVGEFLKEKVFSPGCRYKWDEFVEKAVGEKLNPKYFAEQFVEK